jgi:hypothetical protein
MENLTRDEKNVIMEISSEFIDIHREIVAVEETIKRMTDRSSELIQKLERCREKEREFVCSLSNKYGEGELDPMNLAWKKECLNDGQR